MEPIVKVEDVRSVLSDPDEALQRYVDGVSAAIRSFCGWHVLPVQQERIVVDGPGPGVLELPTLRVESIVKVEVDGVEVEVDEWSGDGLIPGRWPERFGAVAVTMRHGFESAPDLVVVALDAVARASAADPGGLAEQIGPFSFSGSQGGVAFFGHELEVMRRYQLPGAC